MLRGETVLRPLLLVALWLIPCSDARGQQASAPELTRDNLPAWREHILPAAADLKWQQTPWLTTFADGILEANRVDKPLLLWTMNGHPLGCT